MKPRVPFNKAFIVGKELHYISQAVLNGEIKGDGSFTKKCNSWIENKFSVHKALLTNSCTASLELSALLFNIEAGDEIIMPSYTFTSTANAFMLQGGRPVFIDIRSDTLNMDERKIEENITKKTKAICPVHYAGVGCEMDTIMAISKKHNLWVVEDAAQGMMATYKDRYLGAIGDIGTFSFHETKNFSSGEGGAILVNRSELNERAEFIREKGTNRNKFFRGEVDKYTWVDIGSSYLPSEIIAAFLYAQLENADHITKKRLEIWDHYYNELQCLEEQGKLKLPFVPNHCKHNGHIFYMILNTQKERDALMAYLAKQGIGAIFHYIPLHSAPMGIGLGYKEGQFKVTESISNRLLRLPFYNELTRVDQDYVIETVKKYLL